MSQTISVYSEVVGDRGEGEVRESRAYQATDAFPAAPLSAPSCPGRASKRTAMENKSKKKKKKKKKKDGLVNLADSPPLVKNPSEDPDYVPGLGLTSPQNEFHLLMRTPSWAKICCLTSRNSVLPGPSESDSSYINRLRTSLPSGSCLVRDVIESTCFHGPPHKGCVDDRFVASMVVCVMDLRVNSHNCTVATMVDESSNVLGGKGRGVEGWLDGRWIREQRLHAGDNPAKTPLT
ncbi:hypothetical protein TrRE_jg7797 [Triparma retinervis]|uniref:Uncharacterized protein n=1 Tax=Triparma retinervis TaxID=2557542 RepID=A0A9W6ZWY9_9STRA|nr:hypothetical protein TrRE_jg7797 [Triparma retinervis]